jgi:hypothetical protein
MNEDDKLTKHKSPLSIDCHLKAFTSPNVNAKIIYEMTKESAQENETIADATIAFSITMFLFFIYRLFLA